MQWACMNQAHARRSHVPPHTLVGIDNEITALVLRRTYATMRTYTFGRGRAACMTSDDQSSCTALAALQSTECPFIANGCLRTLMFISLQRTPNLMEHPTLTTSQRAWPRAGQASAR
jgi:hypothetical protein